MPVGNANAEGVWTTLPHSDTRAWRYSSYTAVPLLKRPLARQVGAAGYWYVPGPDTPHEIWDRVTGGLATGVQTAAEAIGADKGILGVAGKALGINPIILSVLLIVVAISGAVAALNNLTKRE